MGRSKITRQIDRLMKMPTDMNELQAQATVRDGMASIEVLVLQYGKDEWLHAAASGEEKLCISPDTMPSSEEAGIIMRQSLRLPYQFSLPGMLDTVIEELETVRQTKLREWVGSPQIGKELFLLLDRNGYAMLAGKSIKYDSTYGLQVEREDENGGKRI